MGHGFMTSDFNRIDSFVFQKAVELLNADQIIEESTKRGHTFCIQKDSFSMDGVTVAFDRCEAFAKGYRLYFRCPACSERRQHLYIANHKNIFFPVCRVCLKLNYPSQNLSRWQGAVEATKKQLIKMGYDITGKDTDALMSCIPRRKKGQKKAVYEAQMRKLEALQLRQNKAWIRRVLQQLTFEEAVEYGLLWPDDLELLNE